MATAKENLLDWLRHAHAMEIQAKIMLKAQASRLSPSTEMQKRVRAGVAEEKCRAGLRRLKLQENPVKVSGLSPPNPKICRQVKMVLMQKI